MKFYSNIYSANKKNLIKAAKLIKSGQVIAIPTETVYGLAGNAYRTDAVNKIYKLKKRPKSNPLIVHFLILSHREGSNCSGRSKKTHIKILTRTYHLHTVS